MVVAAVGSGDCSGGSGGGGGGCGVAVDAVSAEAPEACEFEVQKWTNTRSLYTLFSYQKWYKTARALKTQHVFITVPLAHTVRRRIAWRRRGSGGCGGGGAGDGYVREKHWGRVNITMARRP